MSCCSLYCTVAPRDFASSPLAATSAVVLILVLSDCSEICLKLSATFLEPSSPSPNCLFTFPTCSPALMIAGPIPIVKSLRRASPPPSILESVGFNPSLVKALAEALASVNIPDSGPPSTGILFNILPIFSNPAPASFIASTSFLSLPATPKVPCSASWRLTSAS